MLSEPGQEQCEDGTVLFSEPGQKQDKDGMYVLFSELGQEHCEDGIAQVTGDPLPNLRNSNLFVIHITVS